MASVPRTSTAIEDAKAALQRIGHDFPHEARLDELQTLLLTCSENDPLAALAYVREQFRVEAHKEKLTNAVLAAWAKREPAAAWQWIAKDDANPPGTEVETVLQEMGKTDPQGAWQAALDHARKNATEAALALGAALKGMTYAGHFETALRLIDTADLPTSAANPDRPESLPIKDALAAAVTAEWGRYQPDAAKRWALALPEDTVAHYEQALGNLITLWIDGLDHRAAADRVSHLPAGKLRQLAFKSTLRVWLAEGEIDQIADWLGTIEPQADFDLFLSETLMSERVREGKPRLGIRWAKAIHDPELRLQGLTEIITKWAEWDRAAALAYLQASPDLPAETRQEVRRRVEKEI